MRTRLPLLAAVGLLACGGSPRPTPPPPPPPPPSGPTLAGTAPIAAVDEVYGPAFSRDGAAVLLATAGQLYRFDARTLAKIDARPLGTAPRLGAEAVVLHRGEGSDLAVDVAAAARIDVAVPQGYECGDPSFSADASRLARNCTTTSEQLAIVQDARTGATIAKLVPQLASAAPVREGEIIDSGNFVFWRARADGAFQEIKSKVTGPMFSSHSTMSPDERALFTVVDKDWYPDDRSPARMLDPRNGSTRYTLPYDIDRVYFSPDSQRFAAVHLSDEERAVTSITLHRTDDGAVVGKLDEHAAALVAFSPDARALALRGESTLKLYVGIP
jgi:hypothetical protein